MTDLEQVFSTLLAQMPPLPDDAEIDRDPSEIGVLIERGGGQQLHFTVRDDALYINAEVTGSGFFKEGPIDDPKLHEALALGITLICTCPETDEWDATADYGYADSDFIGTETWEDQAGMAALKTQLMLPTTWHLIKVIRFDTARLRDIEAWLKDNCIGAYKRVGWSSGCSTKVGVAFENQYDAIMYTFRWK